MIIGRDKLDSPDEIWYPSLIMTPTGDGNDRHTRLGYLLLEEKSLGDCTPDLDVNDYPTLTLV